MKKIKYFMESMRQERYRQISHTLHYLFSFARCYIAKMKKHLQIEVKHQQISEAMRYCLDSMANVNIISNPNVLRNIRDSDTVMKIIGIGGVQIEISKVGDHPLFGKCWYYPENEFNIISQWKANEQGLMFCVSEDNELAWLVRADVSICFHRDRKDHFYKCPIEKVDKILAALDKTRKENNIDDRDSDTCRIGGTEVCQQLFDKNYCVVKRFAGYTRQLFFILTPYVREKNQGIKKQHDLLILTVESEKNDKDQDDPPARSIPPSSVEMHYESLNSLEKNSKHEFSVEEFEGGSISSSGNAFMSKKFVHNIKQSAIDQNDEDSDEDSRLSTFQEAWKREVDETNQAISIIEQVLDDFEGKEKYEAEKDSQRKLDQISGSFPSAEADSIEPDNISEEMNEAIAEMGFELQSRRIAIPRWNPQSSQDYAWLSDRRWFFGEIQRTNDERVRTYDVRKQSGELTAVEQMIEVSRFRQQGESHEESRQRLFGAGEVKRDFDDYISQENSDLPSLQLLREKSESDKSDEDEDDPPSPFIPLNSIESQCEISNPPEKKSKHEFNVEECERGSITLPSELVNGENYQKYWAFVSKSSSDADHSKTSHSLSEAFKFCLDGMANINVFTNPNLLINIRTSTKPVSIDGIGGKTILIDQVGDHCLFGLCWYYPQNNYNIVSQWQAYKCGFTLKMSDDNEQAWLFHKSVGISVCFDRDQKDHFYKCPVEKVAKVT